MFCQTCGNPLEAGDISCNICGATTIGAGNKEKKSPGVDFDWDLKGFPTPKKTEDIDFNWNINETLNHKEGQTEDLGSTMEKDTRQSSDLMEELNKFFTFEKANEDFQNLLDKEYKYIEPAEVAGVAARPTDTESQTQIDTADTADIDNTSETTEATGATEVTEDAPDIYATLGIDDSLKKNHEGENYRYAGNDGEDREDEDEPEVIWVSQIDEEIHESCSTENGELSEPAQTMEIPNTSTDIILDAPMENKDWVDQVPVLPLWFENNTGQEATPKKISFGRILLIIIVVALLIEVGMLGVQYFIPHTLAAKKAGKINDTIAMSIVNLKDNTIEFFRGDKGKADPTGQSGPGESGQDIDNEVTPPEEPQAEIKEPIKEPTADKTALIAAVAGSNKNIVTIKANDKLQWKQGKEYKLTDIKDSKPLEDNYWYTTAKGDHVYYDKSIVATVIEFDSRWVEYVNGGSNQVIGLTKEGSAARKNAETFSKVGKVNQTFQLLEIGEIRKSEEAFYIWTYEEISEIQGSGSTTNKYNWIYRLEPNGEKMEIVSYYKY